MKAKPVYMYLVIKEADKAFLCKPLYWDV